MTTFASIAERLIFIVGWPHSGWRAADPDDPDGKVLPFRLEITDDGGGHFLFIYESLDGVFCADTWHESLEEAFAAAQDNFGITRSEWTVAQA